MTFCQFYAIIAVNITIITTVYYRKISNISRITSPNSNVSRLVLHLPNTLKPDIKSTMKMQLEQPRQAMFQLHLRDQQFNCSLRRSLY